MRKWHYVRAEAILTPGTPRAIIIQANVPHINRRPVPASKKGCAIELLHNFLPSRALVASSFSKGIGHIQTHESVSEDPPYSGLFERKKGYI